MMGGGGGGGGTSLVYIMGADGGFTGMVGLTGSTGRTCATFRGAANGFNCVGTGFRGGATGCGGATG